jgi:trehalose 6-phosphate synthase
MQRMRRHVMEHNVYRWAANILGDLRELRMEGAENANLGPAGPEPVSAADEMQRKMA